MKINKEYVEKINSYYAELRRQYPESGNDHLQINIADTLGTSIYAMNWEVCKLEDLDQMITDLMLMKEAIEKVTELYY